MSDRRFLRAEFDHFNKQPRETYPARRIMILNWEYMLFKYMKNNPSGYPESGLKDGS